MQLKMNESVLIVAAHPDDEVLGCGGTMARLAADGCDVHVAFLADGIGSRDSEHPVDKEKLQQRRVAARKAAEILGVASVSFDDLPDNRLDTVPLLELVQRVELLVSQHQPNTVFTHFSGDLNVDHRQVYRAVVTACRPQTGHPVHELLCFEVASSTEWQPPGHGKSFNPNLFINIGDTLERKLAALDAYASEMRAWPHPRSQRALESLARWRGATVGCEAAEAFVLERCLR